MRTESCLYRVGVVCLEIPSRRLGTVACRGDALILDPIFKPWYLGGDQYAMQILRIPTIAQTSFCCEAVAHVMVARFEVSGQMKEMRGELRVLLFGAAVPKFHTGCTVYGDSMLDIDFRPEAGFSLRRQVQQAPLPDHSAPIEDATTRRS